MGGFIFQEALLIILLQHIVQKKANMKKNIKEDVLSESSNSTSLLCPITIL